MMLRAITLNKEISCEQICEMIASMVNQYRISQPDLSNSIMVIDIKDISNSIDPEVPKIEMNHNV
jgi:hypothetical protein